MPAGRCYLAPVRRDLLLALVVATTAAGCNDLRDFNGEWSGPRVGDAPAVKVGVGTDASAHLTIDALDPHHLHAMLSVDGMLTGADVTSLPGAEADALAGVTFAGDPLRVYFAFVDVPDGGGQAMAIVALFPNDRVEVRLLRGGTAPIYAIFALTNTAAT